ncbi:MAG: hypothetical protein ACRD2H_05005 [Terriglobales bacterium]
MAKANPRAIKISAVLIAVLLATGAALQRAIAPRTPEFSGAGPAVPSRALAEHLFLGYNGLAADIYWTEAIQYFGQRRIAQSWDYPKLAPLLNLAYDLDPNLISAAQYGAFFLADDPPEAAGQPQAAVALLKKAIHDHRDDWHLYFNLGFVQALNLHDHKAAAETFYAGSKAPNANPALAVLAADYFADVNEKALARALWTEMYHDAPNAQLRANALDHLQALRAEADLASLSKVAAAYRQRAGAWPSSWSDLVRAGLLRDVPRDPQGRAYRLLPGGRFELDPATKILALRHDH